MQEELATDELRREEPDITEKLITAMEGILQMSEAQAKGISTIAEAVSEIRFALERQGSVINELRNSVDDMKTEQISDAVLSDIHSKIKNISEAWNIMLSSSSALEERLSKLEAKTDNVNENVTALFERMDGDVRQLSMAMKEAVEKNNENNENIIEKINAARVAAQRASEAAEEMREVAEINRQAIKGLRERAEGNAAMIEASRKVIEALDEKMDTASNEMNRRLAKNEEMMTERIDYIVSSINEKIDASLSSVNRKIDEMHEAWHKVELDNFEEMEKINLILTEMNAKFERLESLINELKAKPRRAPARRRQIRRALARRPTGAVVDYVAIEEMIVNYVRESGRVTIDAVRGHAGIGETTLRKLLHGMVRDGKLSRQRQGKFVYYSVE